MYGATTSRAEARCLRLSLIYAVLDHADCVRLPHLQAAHAVWLYCQESARRLFGDKTGDPVADKIHAHLRTAGEAGLLLHEVNDRMGRNTKADRLHAALELLEAMGLARHEAVPNSSPPAVRYWATTTGRGTK